MMRILKGLALLLAVAAIIYLGIRSTSSFTERANTKIAESNKAHDDEPSDHSSHYPHKHSADELTAIDPVHEHAGGHELAQTSIDKSFWFEPVSLLDKQHFTATQTELTLSESCQSNLAFTQADTLEQLIAEEYQVDTARRKPEDVFFKAITQFLQSGSEYIQISMLWERDLPATYRYEIFVSSDPRFESNVQQIVAPVAEPKLKDVLASYDFLGRVLKHYQNDGAVLGVQIFEGEINGEDSQVSITTVNGKPVLFNSQAANCQSDYKNNTAFCQCSGA